MAGGTKLTLHVSRYAAPHQGTLRVSKRVQDILAGASEGSHVAWLSLTLQGRTRLRWREPSIDRCIWKRVLPLLGIENLRWHDLRHEAASRLFEKGLHPFEVASITGHKSMQMLKRYTHLKPENLVAKLG